MAHVLLIIYDRTVVAETRHKLEKTIDNISKLNEELERYMAVIDSNVNVIKFDVSVNIGYIS